MQSGGNARAICAALTLLLVLSGCAGQLSSLPPVPATAEGPYQLGAGDRLRLQVFGQEELSQEYVVSDSGAITVPLIGSVDAQGKTLAGLEEAAGVPAAEVVHRHPRFTLTFRVCPSERRDTLLLRYELEGALPTAVRASTRAMRAGRATSRNMRSTRSRRPRLRGRNSNRRSR